LDFHSYLTVIKSSFRMNLRFLAHVRSLCFILFLLLLVSYSLLHILSRISFLTSAAMIFALFWYGKFTGIFPWQSY
jgi:hypothetical protein